MKALKSLIDKLNANPWAYWFMGVFSVLYISQQIHGGASINEILFAQYATTASVIEIGGFVYIIGMIIYKWFEKRNKLKNSENGSTGTGA